MSTGAKRGRPRKATGRTSGATDEGAERYMWAFPDGDRVVLSIPGVRDLEFSSDEARSVGEMLIATANDVSNKPSGVCIAKTKSDELE